MKSSQFILASMGDIGLDGFVMSSVDGTDFVAKVAAENGWWSFEQPMPALFVRASQAWPGLFVDGGANSGFYSLLHVALEATNRAIAFEPYEPAWNALRTNAALNLFEDRISIRNEALSSHRGEADLYIPYPEHELLETRCSLAGGFTQRHKAVVTTPTTTLDFHKAELSKLSILKIDVEGHESSVMLGARETIATFRPIIFTGLLGNDHEEFDSLKQRETYRSLVLSAGVAIEQKKVGHDPGGWNHILAPDEKWAELVNIIEACGVRVQSS